MWAFIFNHLTYLISSILCFIIFWIILKKKRSNLPPGPWGLPVLGYLPFLKTTAPHLKVEKLRKKYGDIFGMYMGSKYTVFLGSAEVVKEALSKDEFCGRPEGAFEVSKDFQHFVSMEGQKWKDHRRLAVKSLRVMGSGANVLKEFTLEQIKYALDDLEQEATSSENGQLNINRIISFATIGIISAFLCGKTYPREHVFTEISQRFFKFIAQAVSSMSLDIYLPALKPIFNMLLPDRAEAMKSFKDFEDFVWSEIEYHEKNPSEEPRDYMDFYMQERSKSSKGKFSKGDLNGNAMLMFFAGADTVRATVEWFLLLMAENPEAQEKAFNEIYDILGISGSVSYEDHDKLPYTEACIHESMRYKPITAFGIARRTTEATNLQGYDIPKDSVVLPCLWSIHHDPKNWKNPDTFNPERFLKPGTKEIRLPETFLPFGSGKRLCIGEKLARMEVYLIAVSILQRFQILPPEGGLRMDGNIRISTETVYPVVRLLKRQT